MKRIPSRELLDDDAGTPAEVAASLADIRLINHYLGGASTTRRMIERVARESGTSSFSMLEVAAGSGELPELIRSELHSKGISLQLTLLDRRPSHLGHGANRVAGDALALPFPNSSFDLVSCCLFVHHLSPPEVNAFVKEALRCSRVAVLINDLVRHPVHLAAACAGRLIYRSRITRNDAPASVRQAYTTSEMRGMLEQSGASRMEIVRRYFYRMGAILWKGPATNGRIHPDI